VEPAAGRAEERFDLGVAVRQGFERDQMPQGLLPAVEVQAINDGGEDGADASVALGPEGLDVGVLGLRNSPGGLEQGVFAVRGNPVGVTAIDLGRKVGEAFELVVVLEGADSHRPFIVGRA
jgi:hypothetical protein